MFIRDIVANNAVANMEKINQNQIRSTENPSFIARSQAVV